MAAHRRPALALALAGAAALWFVRTALAPAFAGTQPWAGGRVSVVARAASQEEIAAAEKQAQLLSWAADKLAGDGSPQSAAMQAKAAQAAQTLAELKQQQGGSAAPASPAYAATATPSAVTPAMPKVPASAVSSETLMAAKNDAELHMWAAKTLAAQRAPQAAAMQAKAAQKVQAYEALRQHAEGGAAVGVPAYAPPPAMSAPVLVAPAAPAAAGAVSPEALKKAKEEADLSAWAAKTLAAQGAPQAAASQAQAAMKLQAYEALKQQAEGGAAPGVPAYSAPAPAAYSAPAATPVAAAAPMAAPAAVGGGANSEDFRKAKEEADLAVWAANTLAAKGAPQAAALQARAQQKLQAYEALKAQHQQMAMR